MNKVFRNNNPFSLLRTTVKYEGLADIQDSKYYSFKAPEYGIKAAYTQIKELITKKYHKTVGSLISSWAPPTNNDTLSYIKFVCTICKCEPEHLIDLNDKTFMCMLITAMIRYECGTCPYNKDTILKGLTC